MLNPISEHQASSIQPQLDHDVLPGNPLLCIRGGREREGNIFRENLGKFQENVTFEGSHF